MKKGKTSKSVFQVETTQMNLEREKINNYHELWAECREKRVKKIN